MPDVRPVFRSSADYIDKQLNLVKEAERPATRLILDIADILTGPTSGGNGRYLAECMCKNPEEVAKRLVEIGDRYLKAAKKKDKRKKGAEEK